jgi:hypothetical protein
MPLPMLNSKHEYTIIFPVAMLLLLSFTSLVYAYSGNNNIIVTNNQNCGWADMDLELNTTSNYVVFDHNGVAGYYGWQVEVFTVQNKPAYQWVSNVKNYKLTDFFLRCLLPNVYYQLLKLGILFYLKGDTELICYNESVLVYPFYGKGKGWKGF